VQCNRTIPLPWISLELLPFCSFLHFEYCPEHNFETTRDINMKLYRWIAHWVEVQCKRNITLSCLILELLPFFYFYTFNFGRDVTLKLQEISTRNFVCKYISLSRSAKHKIHNSALPNITVIALFIFTLWTYLGNDSETTRDINKKYFVCVQNLFGACFGSC
jgi:hypothetical protein